jgi:hypothetical protein
VDERKKDEDIRDVLREERGRGGRPVDTEAEQAERELKDGYRRLISAGATEEEFRDGLIALGWPPDSPEFVAFLRQWRAIQRARRPS